MWSFLSQDTSLFSVTHRQREGREETVLATSWTDIGYKYHVWCFLLVRFSYVGGKDDFSVWKKTFTSLSELLKSASDVSSIDFWNWNTRNKKIVGSSCPILVGYIRPTDRLVNENGSLVMGKLFMRTKSICLQGEVRMAVGVWRESELSIKNTLIRHSVEPIANEGRKVYILLLSIVYKGKTVEPALHAYI